jgi:hypothetical protein
MPAGRPVPLSQFHSSEKGPPYPGPLVPTLRPSDPTGRHARPRLSTPGACPGWRLCHRRTGGAARTSDDRSVRRAARRGHPASECYPPGERITLLLPDCLATAGGDPAPALAGTGRLHVLRPPPTAKILAVGLSPGRPWPTGCYLPAKNWATDDDSPGRKNDLRTATWTKDAAISRPDSAGPVQRVDTSAQLRISHCIADHEWRCRSLHQHAHTGLAHIGM